MDEEDFVEQVADAIEACMDVAEVDVVEGTGSMRVLTGDGETFVLTVKSYGRSEDSPDEDDEDGEAAATAP